VSVWNIPELRRDGEPPTTSVDFRYFMPQTRFAPLCFLCPLWWFTTLAVVFRHDVSSDGYSFERIVVLHSNLKYTPSKREKNTTEACPAFPRT
jgi:hypothetical protein